MDTMVPSARQTLPPQRRTHLPATGGSAVPAAPPFSTLAARDAEITAHQPLVRSVVGKMRRLSDASTLLDFEDLLSYGTEGLIAAVDSFDPTRGAQFSTWAVLKIRSAVLDGVRALDPVSRTMRLRGQAIDRTATDWAHARGHWPTRVELAKALDEPLARLEQTQQQLARSMTTSLDRPQREGEDGSDGGLGLQDMLADDDPAGDPVAALDRQDIRRLLATAVAALPARERLLVQGYYGEDRSLRLIAVQLGVSSSRISQVHARALRLLRAHISAALADEPSPEAPVRTRRRPAQPAMPLVQALKRALEHAA